MGAFTPSWLRPSWRLMMISSLNYLDTRYIPSLMRSQPVPLVYPSISMVSTMGSLLMGTINSYLQMALFSVIATKCSAPNATLHLTGKLFASQREIFIILIGLNGKELLDKQVKHATH